MLEVLRRLAPIRPFSLPRIRIELRRLLLGTQGETGRARFIDREGFLATTRCFLARNHLFVLAAELLGDKFTQGWFLVWKFKFC